MIALPLLAFGVWAMVFRRRGCAPLDGVLAAFIGFGVAVSVLTEAQSAVGAVTAGGSAAAWAILLVAGLVALRRSPAVIIRAADDQRPPVMVLAVVATLLALTLAVALIAPPNSYDAMTYHLTRVEQWAVRGSLASYATFDTRQLFMPSWSEYAMLQFRLLSGGDHFANLVQWLGYVISCGGAALLAMALGGGCAARNVAVMLVVTLPMAIAQASGAQTDVIAAAWAVLACGFGYRLLTDRARTGDLVGCALALGLAAATKQTAILFAAAALLPLAGLLARRTRWRALLGLVTASIVAMALLAGPQLVRNERLFGRVTGDAAWVDDGAAATHAPSAVACTTGRNLALHFGTPIAAVNDAAAGAAAAVCQVLGANPDDPRTTWNPRFVAAPWTTHEESAPNPLHLLVIAGALVALLRVPVEPRTRWFALGLAAGLVAFSAALKWQSYNSRLETPWFVLALAWAAVLLERMPVRWRRILLWVLAVAALPFALCNYTRPLIAIRAIAPRPSILNIPREFGYFMYQPALLQPYLDVAERIADSGCRDVGMHTWPDGWEYAVMALVRDRRPGVRFRAIGVLNQTARLDGDRPPPCLLLQIWPGAEVPPRWAAAWQPLAAWKGPPDQPGIALFQAASP